MDVLQHTLDIPERRENQEKDSVRICKEQNTASVSISSVTHNSPFVGHNLLYQFRAESGGAQAVIQNPFPSGGSIAPEIVGGEARFAFLPSASLSSATAIQPTDPTLPHTGGQFYVMMTGPDVLQSGVVPRTIAPRIHNYVVKTEGPRTPRDERRRAQHNEVERRRRDKINNWIVTLSKIMPDCTMESAKSGASKGEILSKACDYIQELRQHNQHLQAGFKEVKRVQMENQILRQQVEDLRNENVTLRSQVRKQIATRIPLDIPPH